MVSFNLGVKSRISDEHPRLFHMGVPPPPPPGLPVRARILILVFKTIHGLGPPHIFLILTISDQIVDFY